MVKALKESRFYILHSHTIVYVPSASIKDILTQAKLDWRRAKWIATLLEYDLEIKPTKLVNGKGLAKLMAQSNYEVLEVNFLALCSENVAQVEERKYIQIVLFPLGIRTSYMSCKSFKLYLN